MQHTRAPNARESKSLLDRCSLPVISFSLRYMEDLLFIFFVIVQNEITSTRRLGKVLTHRHDESKRTFMPAGSRFPFPAVRLNVTNCGLHGLAIRCKEYIYVCAFLAGWRRKSRQPTAELKSPLLKAQTSVSRDSSVVPAGRQERSLQPTATDIKHSFR